MDVKGLEKVLKQKEAEQAKAEAVLGKAHGARKAAKHTLQEAVQEFNRRRAQDREGADPESYGSFRKELREAEEALLAAKREDAAAAAAVSAAQQAFDLAKDEVARVMEELAKPRMAALEEQLSLYLKGMHEDQKSLMAKFEASVGLCLDALELRPRRAARKLALKRTLVVRPKDPEMRKVIAKRLKSPRVPAGCLEMEYYQAMRRTSEGGNLEFPPDLEQDFSAPDETDRDEVEITWASPPLPELFERITELDLGVAFSNNGRKEYKRLDFETTAHNISVARKAAKEVTHEGFVG
jgi:hypothetical protein